MPADRPGSPHAADPAPEVDEVLMVAHMTFFDSPAGTLPGPHFRAALRAAGFALVRDPDGLVGDGPPPVLRRHLRLVPETQPGRIYRLEAPDAR